MIDLTFAAQESWKGLRRHAQMMGAVVVCVAVSLTMIGASWLLSVQVAQLKGYWYDKVEVSVFLCGTASDETICPDGAVTAAQRDIIRDQLEALPETEKIYYESQAEAFARFSEQYAGSRVLSEVTAETMPESYRVKLTDPTQFQVIADAVAATEGVEKVQDQRKLLAGFFRLVTGLQIAAIALALSQVFIAALVVAATVRIAVHARRKEVAVMRLVGASKAMIRAPFFGEAAIVGAAGSILALGLLAAFQQWVVNSLFTTSTADGPAVVSWTDLAAIAPVLLLAGVGLPVLATAAFLRRHLKI